MSERYRITISLLDIDRLGILMIDKLQKNITGTWVTDQLGLHFGRPIVIQIFQNRDWNGAIALWEMSN